MSSSRCALASGGNVPLESSSLEKFIDDGDREAQGRRKAGVLPMCIRRVWLTIFELLLAGLMIGVVGMSIRAFKQLDALGKDPELKKEKCRLISVTSSAVGLLLWPLLWDYLVGFAVVIHNPLVLLGFVWPIVMEIMDISFATSNAKSLKMERIFGVNQMQADSTTLLAITFAIGSLLFSQARSRLAEATVPLLLYALLILLVFLMPTPSLDPNELTGFAFGSMQRSFYHYSLGLVIAGITVNISGQGKSGLQRALEKLCQEQLPPKKSAYSRTMESSPSRR